MLIFCVFASLSHSRQRVVSLERYLTKVPTPQEVQKSTEAVSYILLQYNHRCIYIYIIYICICILTKSKACYSEFHALLSVPQLLLHVYALHSHVQHTVQSGKHNILCASRYNN